MSSDNISIKLPRKKPNALWYIGGIVFALVVWILFQLFGPSPAIIVSKQTTYITEPLRPDGLPDYEAYVLSVYRDGVTPENNAAVLIWQAMWLDYLSQDPYAALAADLGLKHIPPESNASLSLMGDTIRKLISDWLLQRAATAEGDGYEPGADVDRIIGQAISRPWTDKQIPPLATWLDAHQKQIDLIVEGTKRPRFYFPSPSLLNNESDILVDLPQAGDQLAMISSQALLARAMRHMGEDRLDEAWQDVLALHRLERLVGQGLLSFDNTAARDATITLLDCPRMTVNLATEIQDVLASLSTPSVTTKALEFNRLAALDRVLSFKLSSTQTRPGGRKEGILPAFDWMSCNWNVPLTEMNSWFDRLVAAARQTSLTARLEASRDIEDQIIARQFLHSDRGQWFRRMMSRNERNSELTSALATIIVPTATHWIIADELDSTKFELTRLAAALAVYRGQHGHYPVRLDSLIPAIVKELPVDRFSTAAGQRFIYRQDNNRNGYLLYSVSQNGLDDGGTDYRGEIVKGDWIEEPEGWIFEKSDIVIRLPQPPLKLPTPSKPK